MLGWATVWRRRLEKIIVISPWIFLSLILLVFCKSLLLAHWDFILFFFGLFLFSCSNNYDMCCVELNYSFCKTLFILFPLQPLSNQITASFFIVNDVYWQSYSMAFIHVNTFSEQNLYLAKHIILFDIHSWANILWNTYMSTLLSSHLPGN